MIEIRETIEEFAKEVRDRLDIGFDKMHISHSATDFGKSSYLIIDGRIKIRYSDHSVGSPHRVLEEWHLNKDNRSEILEYIERYFYPERFTKITETVYGDVHETTSRKIQGLIETGQTFEVIEKDIRVSKKGAKISKIRVKNIENIYFIRKP